MLLEKKFYFDRCCCCCYRDWFMLMSGGGSQDPTGFNPEIFSSRRIVVAPAVTVIGFVLMIFGILKNSKNKEVAE